jgi:hypothetical protein
MQEHNLNPDAALLESQLKMLVPADANIDRDQLLYTAGARATSRRLQMTQRVWQLATVCIGVLAVGLLYALLLHGSENTTANSDSHGSTNGDSSTDSNGAQSPSQISSPSQSQSPSPAKHSDDKNAVSPDENNSDFFNAYSSIWNVDGWSPDQLRQHGITVKSWTHPLQGEDPPLPWVEIAFDSSRIPVKQDVVMTAKFISDDFKLTSATRVSKSELGQNAQDPMKLVFVLPESQMKNSSVEIFIWKAGKDGNLEQKDLFEPSREASGYRLSMRRIKELAK